MTFSELKKLQEEGKTVTYLGEDLETAFGRVGLDGIWLKQSFFDHWFQHAPDHWFEVNGPVVKIVRDYASVYFLGKRRMEIICKAEDADRVREMLKGLKWKTNQE